MSRVANPDKTLMNLDERCPTLPPKCLFVLELEQDEYFPHLSPSEVPLLIDQAIQKGILASGKWAEQKQSLKDMINLLIRQGITVRFLDRHPEKPAIRAEYNKKTKTIRIYRKSMHQIQRFFEELNIPVTEEDLFLLHLYHEWFHHLEETKIGRTDDELPRVTIKQKGPFAIRKRLSRLREIAAHAFVQQVFELNWSPLLLDYLLYFKEKGWSFGQIRESFQKEKERIQSVYHLGGT
jgi:hypothetical protein